MPRRPLSSLSHSRASPIRRARGATGDHLAHIAQISQNARATWFALLALLVFVGVTLMGHADKDFFAFGAETQLPLVGITVPTAAFFYAAPVLTAALYAYLHLYLINLWEALAEAPAQIDGAPLADKVFPTLLAHAALWYRSHARDDGCSARQALGLATAFIGFVMAWAFGLIVLALLWWRSMPAHDEWMTLLIVACLWFAGYIGLNGLRIALSRMAGTPRAEVARDHWSRWAFGFATVILLAGFSWAKTEGGLEYHWKNSWLKGARG